MSTALSIPIDHAAGTGLVGAIHVGALDGEAAALVGWRTSLGEALVPRAWPDAPLELEVRAGAGTGGAVHWRSYASGEACAQDFYRLRHGMAPSGPSEALAAPAAGGRTVRQVIQPDQPFVLVWSVGPVSGTLRSLDVLEHGPSSLRIAWTDVFIHPGGLA